MACRSQRYFIHFGHKQTRNTTKSQAMTINPNVTMTLSEADAVSVALIGLLFEARDVENESAEGDISNRLDNLKFSLVTAALLPVNDPYDFARLLARIGRDELRVLARGAEQSWDIERVH